MGLSILASMRRSTIPAPRNPMDKCTVVSIFPKEIREVKPTIQPGTFIIPAGSYEKPSLLTVGSSSWWREIDEEQPLLEIPNSSIQVADSIVRDFCNGLLACNMSDCMPGIFYVPGEITFFDIKKEPKYIKLLDKAKLNQENWYKALVKMADTGWAKTNGNPLIISDDMRTAAKVLNIAQSKDWMKDFTTMEMIRCVACGALRNPDFPICQTCKAIVDPEKAKSLGLEFAK